MGGGDMPGSSKPSASARSTPSGRSRYTKCYSAAAPKGSRRNCTPGRIAFRLMRQVGPAHKGGRPDSREQFLDHRPMQHLLARDCEEHPTQALDGLALIVPKTGACCALEARSG